MPPLLPHRQSSSTSTAPRSRPTSMVSKTSTRSDWSFSLRSRSYHLDDFSSDDDSNDDQRQPIPGKSTGEKTHPSEEARLLGEFDLASRADAASYKPNPWTIAKANAATRAPRCSPPPPKMPSRKHSRAQLTVPDSLRMQPDSSLDVRMHQVEPTVDQPPTVASSKTLNYVHSLDDPHIPSDDTLVDVAPSDLQAFSKLSDDDLTLAPSSCLLSPTLSSTLRKAAIPDSALDSMAANQPHSYRHAQPPNLGDPHRMRNRTSAGDHPSLPDRLSSGRELRSILFNLTQSPGPALNKSSVPCSSQIHSQGAPVPPITAHSRFLGKSYVSALQRSSRHFPAICRV